MRLDADAVAAVDSTGQVGEMLDLADPPARRAVARGLRGRSRRSTRPGGLIVAGMGGSAVGGRLGARRARAAADAAAAWSPTATRCRAGPGRRRSCCARATRAPPRRRWPPTTTRVERGAPRLVATTGGPLAERARRDGVPVIPLPGGFQPRAAVGYSLVSALEAARAGRRGAVAARRGRGGGRRSPRRWPPSGARTATRTARPRRSRARLHGTVPGDHGRRADRAGGLPLEVPAQREREAAGVRRQRCPRPTTTRSCGWAAARELGAFSARRARGPAGATRGSRCAAS